MSGRWHPVSGNEKVSHVAGSDEFALPGKGPAIHKLWVVMADTFSERLVPGQPIENAGCAIVYCTIKVGKGGRISISDPTVSDKNVPPPTEFDWYKWNRVPKLR